MKRLALAACFTLLALPALAKCDLYSTVYELKDRRSGEVYEMRFRKGRAGTVQWAFATMKGPGLQLEFQLDSSNGVARSYISEAKKGSQISSLFLEFDRNFNESADDTFAIVMPELAVSAYRSGREDARIPPGAWKARGCK